MRALLVGELRRRPLDAARELRTAGLVASGAELAALLHALHGWLDADALSELLSASPSSAKNDAVLGDVLAQWMAQLAPSLRGLSLEEALRLFLLLCRLPGEAPRIDRMLEHLSAVHFSENPGGPFADADAEYMFSFCLLMLNTDLHNSNIDPRRKLTSSQFEASCRGINGGGDLNPEFLQQAYASIKAHAFKFP
jgi:hypothetical protein